MQLEMAVRRYLRELEKSPAAAVSKQEIDELRRALSTDSAEHFVAPSIPVANDTWQYRTMLAKDAEEAGGQIIDLTHETRILGFRTTLLLVDDPTLTIVPPREAIDYQMVTNRKREYQATLEDEEQNKPSQIQWANLPFLDNDRRLVNIFLTKAVGYDFQMSIRWAVPQSTVLQMNWGSVQFSLGLFIHDPTADGCC